MARWLRTLGIIGAVLLLVGFTLVGVGYLNVAATAQAAIQCTQNCTSEGRAAINASFQQEELLGLGLIVGGIGTGFVAAVALQYLARAPVARTP